MLTALRVKPGRPCEYDKELGSSDPDLYKTQDSRELVMANMIDDIDYAIEFLPDRKDEPDAPYRATKWAALALKAQFCLFEGTYRKYHGISLAVNRVPSFIRYMLTALRVKPGRPCEATSEAAVALW